MIYTKQQLEELYATEWLSDVEKQNGEIIDRVDELLSLKNKLDKI
jgi:hypothetical protein